MYNNSCEQINTKFKLMKTPYLDEMINELDSYIGSSDNYLSKRGNEKLTELKAIKEQLLLYSVTQQSELLIAFFNHLVKITDLRDYYDTNKIVQDFLKSNL